MERSLWWTLFTLSRAQFFIDGELKEGIKVLLKKKSCQVFDSTS